MVNEQTMANNFDLKVELCGVELDNPVIPASGTFGFGREHNEFYDINILGALSFKGTTREARFGNPTPRIAECRAGMINSVGLQNPGIDAVIATNTTILSYQYGSDESVASAGVFVSTLACMLTIPLMMQLLFG